MRHELLEPNVVSCGAAISACEKGLRWEWAPSLLQQMRCSHLRPGVVSYSAAASASEKGQQCEFAMSFMLKMRRTSSAP